MVVIFIKHLLADMSLPSNFTIFSVCPDNHPNFSILRFQTKGGSQDPEAHFLSFLLLSSLFTFSSRFKSSLLSRLSLERLSSKVPFRMSLFILFRAIITIIMSFSLLAHPLLEVKFYESSRGICSLYPST